MTREQHIAALAAEMNVSVHYDVLDPYKMFGWVSPVSPSIHLTPFEEYGWVTSPDGHYNLYFDPDVLYFIALHELGHIATGRPAPILDSVETLQEEGESWLWALEHTKFPVEGAPVEFARAALERYRDVRDHIPDEDLPSGWLEAFGKMIELAERGAVAA